jgi:hypothetical protein
MLKMDKKRISLTQRQKAMIELKNTAFAETYGKVEESKPVDVMVLSKK